MEITENEAEYFEGEVVLTREHSAKFGPTVDVFAPFY